ncbi:putative helicase [Pseudomonas phage pPa_SNUABM_DT01]|nr:putative helicase [Pseudomonas phage pPa_SNUABM_DT01]
MKIDVYSHALKVTGVTTERDLQAMLQFCRPLIEMGYEKRGKRFIPKGLRTFAAATKNRQEFSFHRNQLQQLKRHLFQNCGYAEHLVPITHHLVEDIKVEKVKFDVRHMHPPRERQVGIIQYVLDDQDPKWDPIIKMVTLQTGGGKTFVAQFCMNELGVRTVIHFKGGYVERWKNDLEETFKFKRGEFLIVRGSKDLIALQQMALDGDIKAQVIIITSATMRDYIKNYEESNGNSKIYPIKPIDFYPKLGVGFRTTDELHQEFHNNYRIDLYTHIPKALGLSATMTSSDAFKNRMYDIGYPVMQRHDGGGYNVYIGVTAILYHMDPEVRIRYMGGQGYSHTTFEESIMRHKGLLKNYLRMIDHAIYNRYVSVREEGQKALVFFARVDLCTLMVERLKKMYPELNVVRYVGSEGDSYEELLEADIGVTTIGSGGTAIDIKNLRCSFMTTAIDSRQSNEQVLGRTRPLKDWPDITPEFIYFGCLEIEQHCKYHRNKIEFFKGKVLSHMEVMSKYVLQLQG